MTNAAAEEAVTASMAGHLASAVAWAAHLASEAAASWVTAARLASAAAASPLALAAASAMVGPFVPAGGDQAQAQGQLGGGRHRVVVACRSVVAYPP